MATQVIWCNIHTDVDSILTVEVRKQKRVITVTVTSWECWQ